MKINPAYSLLFSFFLIFAFAPQNVAQSNPADSHLIGTLTDPSGAGVSDVQIAAKLESDSNAQPRKATSNADGSYSLAIPPGRYRVQFVRSPFTTREISLIL